MQYLIFFVNSNPAAEAPAFQWFKDTGNLALGEGQVGSVSMFSTQDDCHTVTSAMDLYTKLHAILGDFYPDIEGREAPAAPVGIFAISDEATHTIDKAISKGHVRKSSVTLPDDTVVNTYRSTGDTPFLHIPQSACTELKAHYGFVSGYARLVTEEEKKDGNDLFQSNGTDWKENVTLFLGYNGQFPSGVSFDRNGEDNHTMLRCVMGTWNLVPEKYRWTGDYWVFLPGAYRGQMFIGRKDTEGKKRKKMPRGRMDIPEPMMGTARPEVQFGGFAEPAPPPYAPPTPYEPLRPFTGVPGTVDHGALAAQMQQFNEGIQARNAEVLATEARLRGAANAALNPLGTDPVFERYAQTVPATMGGAGATTLGNLRDNPF